MAFISWLRKIAAAFKFGSSTPLQVAALPVRIRKGKLEVCLITSRGTGRWIIPKGWPEPGKTLAETAQLEAWEEAGLKGEVAQQPLGECQFARVVDPGVEAVVRLRVFVLVEPRQAKRWPEKGERKLKWLNLEEAAEKVADDGLRALIIGARQQLFELASIEPHG